MANYMVAALNVMGDYDTLWSGEAVDQAEALAQFLAEQPGYDGEITMAKFEILDSKELTLENGKVV